MAMPASIGRSWIAVLGLLLLLLPFSSQREVSHPLGDVLKGDEVYTTIGIISSYQDDYESLVSSGIFTPTSLPVQLYGRTFYAGKLFNQNVVYVMSGPRRLNAGVAVQILMDVYKVNLILQYGTAGSANSSLSYGDVSVPKELAFTACWRWLRYQAPLKKSEPEPWAATDIKFGEFGYPENGQNLLEGFEFKSETTFAPHFGMEKVFWVETKSLSQVEESILKDLKLDQCVGDKCLLTTPKVVIGLRGSTSDIFVDNAAYRQFLTDTYGVSTIDQEGAAVVTAARSGSVPVHVFLGVSDLAGGDTDYSSGDLSSLPAANALKAIVAFIRPFRPLLPK